MRWSLRSHVHALQDECRDHVEQEEDKLHKELQQTLTPESSMCRDQLHQALQGLQHQACQEEYADEASTHEIAQLHHAITEHEDATVRLEAHSLGQDASSRQHE